jgi:hypothetical protein
LLRGKENLSVASTILVQIVLIKTNTATVRIPNSIQVNSFRYDPFLCFPENKKARTAFPAPRTGNAREAGDIESSEALLKMKGSRRVHK